MDRDQSPAPADPQHPVRTFLLLLLAADAIFVVVHLVHALSPFFNDRIYSIEQDRGYAEVFQYVKTFWVVIMLATLAWRTREPVYIAWMSLYAYLLFDDALFIHEGGGAAIAARLGYEGALGLRAVDFGELTVEAVSGFAFLAFIAVGYLRSARDARNASIDLALLLGLLVYFGVLIDMLHVVARHGPGNVIFAVVEDGGEMIAMSLTCWYAMGLVGRRGQVPAQLWQRLRPR